MDQEIKKLQGELEEAVTAKERLQSDYVSLKKVSENRKNALDDAFARLQEKKVQMESQTAQINKMAEEIDNANRKYEESVATLSKKDSALQSLRLAHDQLRAQFNEYKKKQEEDTRGLSFALDEATNKCDEQERNLKQRVREIENLKHALSSMQKKCTAAEAVAEEKTKLLRQLESEIESKEAALSILSENKTHSEVLKVKLAECERSLARESSWRVTAQKALDELNIRGGHLHQVEQAHSSLKEELKWRKEQFGLLEDAHKKLQRQLKDREAEWEGEKDHMINEISSLECKFESQVRLTKDLEMQLQTCNQALAHEQSVRRTLEIEAQKSQDGYEKATAECAEARSVIKNLTEKSKEIGHLRDLLASKERKLREMEVKHNLSEQENRELKFKLDDLQAFKSGTDETRGCFEKFKLKYTSMEEAYKECSQTLKRKASEWNKEREELVQSLNVNHDTLESRDKRIHELEIQLEGALASVERLAYQKAELSQKLTIFESESQQDRSKLTAQNLALEADLKKKNEELDCLNEQLQAKQKSLEHVQGELVELKASVSVMSVKCESAERLEREFSTVKDELNKKREQIQGLSKSLGLLQQQLVEKEQSFSEDTKRLTDALEKKTSELLVKKKRESELQNDFDRLHEVLEKTRATAAASDIKAEEYRLQLQSMQQELFSAMSSLSRAELKNKSEKEALLDAMNSRDRKIEELNNLVLHLEQNIKKLNEKEKSLVDVNHRCKELQDQMSHHLESIELLNGKIELATNQKLMVERERDALLKSLEKKESDSEVLKTENCLLLSEKTAINDSLRSQERKYSKLLDELNANKLSLDKACEKLELANSEISAQAKHINELQSKLDHFDVLHEELSDTKTKLQQSTYSLEEAQASVRERNERIFDFESAAEQLKNQILLLKHDISENEKDRNLLKRNLEGTHMELRAKEEEIAVLNSKFIKAWEKNEEKQVEVQRLHDELHEMEEKVSEARRLQFNVEVQLKSLEGCLKDKETSLDVARLDIQQKDNAIGDLKMKLEEIESKLIKEERISSDKQLEIDRLRVNLDRVELSEQLSLQKLKEGELRLIEVEKAQEDNIFKLQDTIFELQQELSLACLTSQNLQQTLESANEEIKILSLYRDQNIVLEGQLEKSKNDFHNMQQDYEAVKMQLSHTMAKMVSHKKEFEQDKAEEKWVNTMAFELEKVVTAWSQVELMTAVACRNEYLVNRLEKTANDFEEKVKGFENLILESEFAPKRVIVSNSKDPAGAMSSCLLLKELLTSLPDIRMDTIYILKEVRNNILELKSFSEIISDFEHQLETFQRSIEHKVVTDRPEFAISELHGSPISLNDLLPRTQDKQVIDLQYQLKCACLDLENVKKELSIWKDKVEQVESLNNRILSELEDANMSVSILTKKVEETEDTRFHLQRQVTVLKEELQDLTSKLSSTQEQVAFRDALLKDIFQYTNEIEANDMVLQMQLNHVHAKLSRRQDGFLDADLNDNTIVNEHCKTTLEDAGIIEITKKWDVQLAKYIPDYCVDKDKIGMPKVDRMADLEVVTCKVQEYAEEQSTPVKQKLLVHLLMKKLDAAKQILSEKDIMLHKLSNEVESLQSLVKRLEKSNSLLVSNRDSITIDPEKPSSYQRLSESLIRDQLRLKKLLENYERRNKDLLEQLAEMEQCQESKLPLEDQEKENSTENSINMPSSKRRTEADICPINEERPPLHELNAQS